MPATKKQMRTAGRELRLRREGKLEQEVDSSTRPMGGMSETNLRKYAQTLDKEIAKLERRFKETGSFKHAERLRRAEDQKRAGR